MQPHSPTASGSQSWKRHHFPFPSFYLIAFALSLLSVSTPAQDIAVSLPPLDHYSKLWTESLFTTRALPPPEAPAGPNFATNLALTGTFEVSGKMAAVLIDKATSGVMQVLIGEDNAEGIRISKVEPGLTPDKMRIQLQKGREFGWVSFSDDSGGAGAGGEVQPSIATNAASSGPLTTRQGSIPPMPQPNALLQQQSMPLPVGLQNVPRALPAVETIPPASGPPPSLRSGAPTHPGEITNDVPLPPP